MTYAYVNHVHFTVTDVQILLLAPLARLASNLAQTTDASAQGTISSTPVTIVFHVLEDVKFATLTQHVPSASHLLSFNKTTVSLVVAKATSLKAVDALTVLPTVLVAHQTINVSSAPTILSCLVGSVTLLARLEPSPTDKVLFVLLATVLAEHASIIQVHVPVVILAKDFCRRPEMLRVVLRNVLKELSLKMEFVRYVILDVRDVWVQPHSALLVLLVDFYSTELAGIFALVSWLTTHAQMFARKDISKLMIENADNAALNAVLVTPTQLA